MKSGTFLYGIIFYTITGVGFLIPLYQWFKPWDIKTNAHIEMMYDLIQLVLISLFEGAVLGDKFYSNVGLPARAFTYSATVIDTIVKDLIAFGKLSQKKRSCIILSTIFTIVLATASVFLVPSSAPSTIPSLIPSSPPSTSLKPIFNSFSAPSSFLPSASIPTSPCTNCCQGISASTNNQGFIGNDSCNASLACPDNTGTIQEYYCNSISACGNNEGKIKEFSCNKPSACNKNIGDIGKSSCSGIAACDNNDKAIGDNMLNLPSACGS